MRRDRPSFTATVVAFGRGVGLGNDRRDDVARELVSAPFAHTLEALERSPNSRAVSRAARLVTFGLVDHAALRMAAVDDAVGDAVDDGCRQVVILGAGLDSRAWRMEALADAMVLEVDHPATQAYKRERVGSLAPIARGVVFIPVDFQEQSIAEVLPDAGHDPAEPTLWVWEAVSMYLRREAIDSTLRQVGTMSAPGSWMAWTYMTPRPLGIPMLDGVARGLFHALGEPLLGALEPAEVQGMLAGVGYETLSDTGSREWGPRYGGSARLARPFAGERLAVARSTR